LHRRRGHRGAHPRGRVPLGASQRALRLAHVAAMTPRLFRASAVFAGNEPAIRDGAVVVDGNGTILDVGSAEDVMGRHPGAESSSVTGVLLPGLVNAHMHLELSALRGKVTGGRGFVGWLDSFIGLRAAENPEDDTDSIDKAAAEVDRFGTAAVGEVTNTLAGV